jgi:two-component system cell cycle sensor histidine kinase/response regulator CckA
MKKTIRVLIVEAVENDALLLVAELQRGGYEVPHVRVDTAAAMRSALKRQTWDLILCDFTMPHFSGAAALQLARESGTDAPFICVSGTTGEDVVTDAMKSGAQDYIMKPHLARLVPTVERELHKAGIRREGRQTDTAMRESEHKYRHLFEALSDAVFLIDEESGRIVDINSRAENLLGRSRAEILGTDHVKLLARQNERPGDDVLRATANGEHPGGCELEVVRHDGRIVPVQASASRIKLYGRPLLLTLLRDVTERKRMDAQLRQLSCAVEQSPVSIVITDPAGNIQYVNSRFTAVTGYSFTEVVGKNPRILKSGEVPAGVYAQLWQAITSGQEWHGEFHNRKKNGDIFWEAAAISPILDEAGRISHFLAVKEDITTKKELEAQLIEAQKMEVLGHLAGGVAHDFNNILAVIMGYCNLMTADLGEDSPFKKYADEIQHAADRATGLTRQLLIFSRKQIVQPVVLDLNEVVKELNKMLRRLIDEHIEMTITPGRHLGHIRADAGHVGQVLMNLTVNARDAMPNGGKITITTENVTLDEKQALTLTGAKPGNYVRLGVSDTGTGMTADVKARVFDAFFTTKPKGKGTGLGLATCQTIVKQSGGFITLNSEPGMGATFGIYFPRVDQPLESDTHFINAGPVPRGTETLLMVEDEPDVRHLAAGVLEAQGYTVLRAANGQDALHLVREHKGPPIRLVITDVVMPVMGGKVMAEWLKTTYPDLKILFTSGYTDEAVMPAGAPDPNVQFLAKPYTPAALARKVREQLDAPSHSSDGHSIDRSRT